MLRGYMAGTFHFITRHPKTRRLVYHAELGVFRYVRGEHTGQALAQVYMDILSELGVVGKVRSSLNTFSLLILSYIDRLHHP